MSKVQMLDLAANELTDSQWLEFAALMNEVFPKPGYHNRQRAQEMQDKVCAKTRIVLLYSEGLLATAVGFHAGLILAVVCWRCWR